MQKLRKLNELQAVKLPYDYIYIFNIDLVRTFHLQCQIIRQKKNPETTFLNFCIKPRRALTVYTARVSNVKVKNEKIKHWVNISGNF